MTSQEINIAIAETQGLDVNLCPAHHSRTCCGRNGYPNYHGSLDAIVPVVRAMDSEKQNQVFDLLIEMNPCDAFALSAPAQWCEAVLRAEGIWK